MDIEEYNIFTKHKNRMELDLTKFKRGLIGKKKSKDV
jgi:hypothetical protein